MKKNEMDKDFAEIKNLILKEKREALQGFRQEEFNSRLNQQIKAESLRPIPTSFWTRKIVFASGAALLLIAVVWAVIHIFTPSPFERYTRNIERALGQASNLQTAKSSQSSFDIEHQPGDASFYELEWAIKRVVYSIQREEISDGDIPSLFQQVLQSVLLDEVTGEDEAHVKEVNRKTESLLEERDLHQLFSQALKKIMEV